MISLSNEAAALARRLAAAESLSVEDAVRRALEARAHDCGMALQPQCPRDTSPEAVAARIARFDAFAQKIAVAPINDPRPISEIVDGLNAV